MKAAVNRFHGRLQTDGITPACRRRWRAAARKTRRRDRLFEVPLAQQLSGLRDDLYDAASMADEVGDASSSNPPGRMSRSPCPRAMNHWPTGGYRWMKCCNIPWLGDPAVCEGHAKQIDRILRKQDREPLIEQYVATFDVMMTFVSAGLALGLAGAAHIASSREPGVVGRPLAGKSPMLTTYLLRRDAEPSQALARFIERVEALGPGDA